MKKTFSFLIVSAALLAGTIQAGESDAARRAAIIENYEIEEEGVPQQVMPRHVAPHHARHTAPQGSWLERLIGKHPRESWIDWLNKQPNYVR